MLQTFLSEKFGKALVWLGIAAAVVLVIFRITNNAKVAGKFEERANQIRQNAKVKRKQDNVQRTDPDNIDVLLDSL